MSWNLIGKKALILGGTTGIRAATAKELLRLGAELWVTGRNNEKSEDFLRKCNHPSLYFIQAACSLQTGIFQAHVGMEALDIWKNKVEIDIRRRTGSFMDNQFHEMLQSNVNSAWKMAQRIFLQLEKFKEVLIRAVSGITQVSGGLVYGFTKAALIQLTKEIAAEWGSKRRRVNTFSLWYIKTPISAAVLQKESIVQEIENNTALKKLGNPVYVVAVFAFLAMKKLKFIRGQKIAIDGEFDIHRF